MLTVAAALITAAPRPSAGPLRVSTREDGTSTVLASRLVDAVSAEGAMSHLEALQQVADAHQGTRASSTAGYDASVEYVAGQLRDAGFVVETPPFSYQERVVLAREVRVRDLQVRADPLRFSVDTAAGGVTGPLVVLAAGDGPGCEAADFAEVAAGAVVLIARGDCSFKTKADRAATAGAAGVVVVNRENGPLRDATLGEAVAVPVAGVSRSDGESLAGRAGEPVTLDVRSSVQTRTSRNVVAQTKTGRTDAVVVVGGHLDSVEAGPGINDNGTGSAGVLEIALQLGSAPDVEQAVRFAWWGAEEAGLLGSTAYVEGLNASGRRDLGLYLNVDMIGSPNPGFFVYDGDDSARVGAGPGPPGSAALEQTMVEGLAARGVISGATDFDGRSDYGPFTAAGVPAGGLFSGAEEIKDAAEAAAWGGEAGAAFDPCYHRACDDLDNVDGAAVDRHLDALAHTVGVYAGSATGPVPPTPPVRQPVDPALALAPGRRVRRGRVPTAVARV